MESKAGILDKLAGIYLIINGFLPILLLVALVSLAHLATQKVSAVVHEYTQSLTVIVNQANGAKTKVTSLVADLKVQADAIKVDGTQVVTRISTTASEVNNALAGFESAFAAPFKDVPKYLGGELMRSGMRALGRDIKKPFEPLNAQITAIGGDIAQIDTRLETMARKIAELNALQDYLAVVEQEYTQLLKTVASSYQALKVLGEYIVLGFSIVLIWVGIGYFFWLRERIKKGMALLAAS